MTKKKKIDILEAKYIPKRNGHKAEPSTALFRLLPLRLSKVLLRASNHWGRICPSLVLTVTYSKNSFLKLIDWNPCSTESRAGSGMLQKIRR